MSDVFELPVVASDVGVWMSNDLPTGMLDKYAAHAINNVDALADALDACVKVLGQMPAGEPVNDSDRAYHQALEALNAYRGTK